MSSEKEAEAKKAIEVAEKKLSNNDYVGAKKFAYKAQRLHPNLNGLKQFLTMIDIYISATTTTSNGVLLPDWYGVLGVEEDPTTSDNETLKRQYKKLALLIHPDKNKFNGAEGATKLVLEAWSVLSDETKRIEYDLERRKSKLEESKKMKKKKRRSKPFKAKRYGTFWTVCDRCKTYCQFFTLICPSCGERMRRCVEFERFFKEFEVDRAKDAHYERMKRWFEPELYSNEQRDFSRSRETTGNPNSSCSGGAERHFDVDSTLEAERLFKKPMGSENPNSSCFGGAKRFFEKPMGSGNADSTSEAERLFKKPKGSGNVDSTFEAERLFKEPIFF